MKALAATLTLSAVLVATGCASTSPTQQPPSAHSSAHKSAEDLASLYEGHEPAASDPLVSSIEQATVALKPYCKAPPDEIDGQANAMLEDLKNHEILESPPGVLGELLAFYRHADSIVRKTKCSEVAAAYLVLREDGGKAE